MSEKDTGNDILTGEDSACDISEREILKIPAGNNDVKDPARKKHWKSEEKKKNSLANLGKGRPFLFKKGHTGRIPKSVRSNALAKGIRSRTGDGRELIDSLLSIVRDEGARIVYSVDQYGKKHAYRIGASYNQKIDAIKVLFERGWGRVPMKIEMGGPDGEPIKVEHTKKEVFEKLVVLLNAGALPVLNTLEDKLPATSTPEMVAERNIFMQEGI